MKTEKVEPRQVDALVISSSPDATDYLSELVLLVESIMPTHITGYVDGCEIFHNIVVHRVKDLRKVEKLITEIRAKFNNFDDFK